MKLKTKYLLLSLAINLIFGCLLTFLYFANRALFFTGELLLLVSIALSIWIYRAIGRPFDLISAGTESLKDKDFSSKLNLVGHSEMDELISVYNMMIGQLREERLQHIEKASFLEKLIEASPSGIIIFDFDGNIYTVNPAAAAIIGLKQNSLAGRRLNSIPGRLARELESLETDSSKIINLNGLESYKCYKSRFADRGHTRTFITIDELTKEIYIKEKNAYEKVIKIMSHEVNNSIGAINSILNSCLNYKVQLHADDREDYANALNISISRNKNLSGLMSNFARVIKVPEPVIEPVDVIKLIHEVAVLMEPEAENKNAEWVWEIESAHLEIQADYQQMEQVFINILKNAIEALQHGGTIKIQTTNEPQVVNISNTGAGISKEAGEQIFSPFFSTKKNGQGIGLMLCREILYNHHFKFSLESKSGWTEFKIYM